MIALADSVVVRREVYGSPTVNTTVALIVVLVLIALACWLIPMDARLRTLFIVVAVVSVIAWVLWFLLSL